MPEFPLTVGQFVTIMALVMTVVYVVSAVLTRASGRRIAAALVAGLIAAFIGAGLDAIGHSLGLWHYVVGSPAHAPWLIYVAAGFLQAALVLIAWRLRRSFPLAVPVLYIPVVAIALTLQDYGAEKLAPKILPAIQVIEPGIAPAFGDFVVWATVTIITMALTSALAGSAPATSTQARYA